jgi:alkylation response protein AidB-like acyl-CoA dehydrogenase
MMYPGLTHGAGRLIQTFGTAKQKKLFLKKMFTGEWTGTMLLTEPEAGSDVGALTTSAVKNDDGTYSITGNKIFISSGEHDMAENIIHPVLARIEGAPQGTKGISLFLVPKIRVNDDGSLGEFNDVVCTGVEEKLGIHGNATCSLSLGSKGNCQGTLLGEKNKGMRAMFQMMNEARLLVGLQGLACASAAYLYAVNYARMRSLLYYIGNCQDKFKISAKEEDKAKYQGLMDLLIPIAKGYVTDKAFEVCSLGVQVYGGYGYIKEYPMEQLLRDCRITQIYEGTNGIQAMDLLGRKLGMNKGKPIMDLLGEIQQTIAGAKSISNLADIANKVEAAVNKLGEVALHIGQIGMSPDTRMNAFAHAYNFMEVSGDVIFAWLLLWRASIAAQNLENGAGKRDAAYFEGQLKSAEFFVHSILPVTLGKMDVILTASSSAVDISEDAFGGK